MLEMKAIFTMHIMRMGERTCAIWLVPIAPLGVLFWMDACLQVHGDGVRQVSVDSVNCSGCSD